MTKTKTTKSKAEMAVELTAIREYVEKTLAAVRERMAEPIATEPGDALAEDGAMARRDEYQEGLLSAYTDIRDRLDRNFGR